MELTISIQAHCAAHRFGYVTPSAPHTGRSIGGQASAQPSHTAHCAERLSHTPTPVTQSSVHVPSHWQLDGTQPSRKEEQRWSERGHSESSVHVAHAKSSHGSPAWQVPGESTTAAESATHCIPGGHFSKSQGSV